VIADRHPLVIREERVVGPEHAANIGGVVHRGVEVCVISDLRRKQ
jgi:hypothetical protein